MGGGETGPSGRCILGGEKLAEWKEWTLDGAGEPAGLILAEGFILFSFCLFCLFANRLFEPDSDLLAET